MEPEIEFAKKFVSGFVDDRGLNSSGRARLFQQWI
jgi:hypothetical protein